MNKKRLFLRVLIPCFLFLAFSLIPVNAEEIGLGISKSIFDITLLPGSRHSDNVIIVNRSRELPLPVNIVLNLWDLKEGSEDIEFVLVEPTLNATRWFTLNSNNYILAPGEEKKIQFSITPPRDVSPGTYLVTMRFQPVLPPSYFEQGSSRVIPEIASLFFLRVNDLSLNETVSLYKADLLELELISFGDKRSLIRDFILPTANAGVFDDAVRKIVASISNKGLYHFAASGYIEIRNWYGGLVARKDLPSRYILPKHDRKIEIEIIPESSLPESTSLFRRAPFVIRDLLYANSYFGPYTATLVLQNPISVSSDNDTLYIGSAPDNKAVLIEQTVSFWIIPWKFWLIPILIVFLLLHFVWRKRNRLRTVFKVLTGKSA
ncbi:MAG: hypothetical protein HYT12_04305 [Candidatus Liptonbacteria bacterium]|nr:hypothetical protein [Candidatus Liptonbacteria bacterium]